MGQALIQIATTFVKNGTQANEQLRLFQKEYPKRKIIGVSLSQSEPLGWFMTITYEINL